MICKNCKRKMQIGDYPFCNGDQADHRTRRSHAQAFRPVVIFRDAKGNVKFPGNSKDLPPKGFERVELSTIRSMEKFEREMNGRSRQEYERGAEAEARAFADVRRRMRDDLEHGFVGVDPRTKEQKTFPAVRNMSALGQEFARAAMRRNDARPRERYDPGFHLDVLAHDAGNRMGYRSEETGWRERKD